MKRRIIGSILVIVMLVLSLASCAYSYANDKELATYAPFTAEEKAALEAAIAAIKIEDGDFTTDPETRAKKVIETINEAFANAASNGEKLTKGTPNALRDLVSYCYYASAVKDGETFYFYASTMKDTSAKKLQLGKEDYDSDLEDAVAKVLATLDFTDKTYSSTTTSTVTEDGTSKDVLAAAGDLVFVSYKISYMEKAEDGTEKEKTVTFTNHPVIVKTLANDATATSLEEYLCGKQNNKTLDKQTFTVNGVETNYSDIKINWIANGSAASTFTDTLEDSLTTTTTQGSKTFDEGTEVTYYLYPTHYVAVEEYNATNLINTVLGDGITYDLVIAILYGEDYVGLDEDDEEDAKKIEELAELVKVYEYKEANGNTVTLKDLVESIAKLQKELEDAKTALEDAEETAEEKLEAKEAADKAVTEAGDNVTDKLKNDQTTANDAYATAEAARAKAATTYDEAKKARDEKVNKLLTLTEGIEENIAKGYKRYTYDYLQYQYNNEIKNKLAKEIYYFINKYIAITGVPEGAVELTYKQLMENHEYEFYNGDASSDQSNYNKYLNNGLFKGYLKETMNANSYEEACQLVREEAKKINEPLVRIYRAAEVYGVLVSDKDFEDYKKNDETSYYYTYYESSYGENSVRHAYQFDQLINYWLEVNEDENVKAPADENGYVMETVKYKGIASYEFGTPASEAEDESTENN